MNRKAFPELVQSVTFKEMKVTSPAFSDSDMLPARFSCYGENINPPLVIDHIPAEAQTLAIIMTGTYDGRQEWAHWLAWNIPPVTHIAENRQMEMEGINYFSRHGYDGPCPAGGLHTYDFKVYALDDRLQLPSAVTKSELERAISDHILAFGYISCFYHHPMPLKQ